MLDTAAVDEEIAQAEAKAQQLRTAKQQHRFQLQGRLASLQFQLTALQSRLHQIAEAEKKGAGDPNADPRVLELAQAWHRTLGALRDHAHKQFFGHLGDRSATGYYERVEAEEKRLRAEAEAAQHRYQAAVVAKNNELWAAHEQATAAQKAQVESDIIALRQQIEATETELRRTASS